MSVPIPPTKEGFTFGGWSPALPGTMPAENVTHTAQWNILGQYTLTFDSTGGSAVSAITQYEGSAVNPPADPTKTGYTFTGWSPTLPGTMPSENVTHTAQWTVNQYTLTLDSAGGSSGSPITQDFGTAVTSPTVPTRTGYTFNGWIPALPGTMPAANATHTAQWTINQYTLTFDTAGGNALSPITQDFGTAVTPPANPTKEGYTFTGWSPALPSTMPAGHTAHVAQWTISQYMLTFDSAGGSAVSALTQDFGTAVTSPANPTKEGYTFAGWSPALPLTMPGVSATHTAQWTANQYTLTFDSAGGSSVAPLTQDHGSSVTPPADPTRSGYTFTGWNPTVPSTMPAGNATYTAVWQINSSGGGGGGGRSIRTTTNTQSQSSESQVLQKTLSTMVLDTTSGAELNSAGTEGIKAILTSKEKIRKVEVVFLALKLQGISISENYDCKQYFDDLTANTRLCQLMELAADNGIISAENDTANAADYITRAEAFAILYAVSGLSPEVIASDDDITLYDTNITLWQKNLIKKIYATNFALSGEKPTYKSGTKISGYFYPNKEILRSEVYNFAKRILAAKNRAAQ